MFSGLDNSSVPDQGTSWLAPVHITEKLRLSFLEFPTGAQHPVCAQVQIYSHITYTAGRFAPFSNAEERFEWVGWRGVIGPILLI